MVGRIHFLLIVFLAMGIKAFGAQVQALLDANRIATGEGASLTIQVTGGQPVQPEIPQVPGLIIDFQSQSQMFTVINGVTTQAVSYTYLVGSQVAGEYTVPSFIVKVNGSTLSTTPQKLTVYDDGSVKPDPLAKNPGQEDPNRWGRMSVVLAMPERQDIYLGEIAPVRIQAWFPMDARVQLNSAIQPESGSYTLHHVNNQPQQTEEIKDGESFRVLTWFGGISATKAGAQSVKLSMKVTVARPDSSQPLLRPRSTASSVFSPFGRGANTRFNEKEITLISENMSLQVKPLPEEGKPDDFSGAVGEFAFDALEIPSQWKTGEPQRVALRIRGSGNFANMKAPELRPAELWKWYPGQDQFTPGDIASFSGSKVFQYNAIARKNGDYPVAFELSYFDPQQARYRSVRSQEQTIRITGDPVIEESSAPQAEVAPPPEPSENLRAPLRSTVSFSSMPVGAWRWFHPIILPVVAVLLALMAPLVAIGKRKSRDPRRLARMQQQREIQRAMKRMVHAEQQQNIMEFWQSALHSVQLAMASSVKMVPGAISLHDVNQRFGADSPVTAFFREADRWTYGSDQSAPDWARWRSMQQQALSSLRS